MKDAQQSAVKRELSVFVDLDHTMLVFNLLCCQMSGISSWNNLIAERTFEPDRVLGQLSNSSNLTLDID